MKVKIKMTSDRIWEFNNDNLSPLEMHHEIVKGDFYILEKNAEVMINVKYIESVECHS